MLEIFGLVFGGISRLGQHWMELKDKQKEREHEAVMFEKQSELADKRFAHDADLRQMDATSAEATNEWNALIAGVEAQSKEAQAAGGLVASLSASVRPVLTYWHCIILYTLVKACYLIIAMQGGISWTLAVTGLYTEADKAICFSMISWWFTDRSLRKGK